MMSSALYFMKIYWWQLMGRIRLNFKKSERLWESKVGNGKDISESALKELDN